MNPYRSPPFIDPRWPQIAYNIPLNWTSSALAIPPATQERLGLIQRAPCALCGRLNCMLKTHRTYLARLHSQGFRAHDVSRLMSTSFASSYAYNPLSVAINHVWDKLQLDIDPSDLGGSDSLPAALNKLIAYDIGRNTPFVDPAGNMIGEVAAEWLVSSSVDEIACASTLNLWLNIEWVNTRKPALQRCSSKLTSFFLEMLREQVEGQMGTTMGIIFAASNHLATCLIFFDLTTSQIEVMMNGLQALVDAQGGFETLTKLSRPGLVQSLLWNDVLFCAFTGDRPRFHVQSPPSMPYSLMAEWVASSPVPLIYGRCCGPDLIDTAKYLRMFLRFRHGTETRALTKIEYQYLISRERSVHVQLLDQAARYHDTGTISECIILAVSLMRMAVLCVWEQHIVCRKKYVQRLDHALRRVSYHDWVESDAICALIWICYVVLAQSQAGCDTHLILTLLSFGLKRKMGWDVNDWPDGWERGFMNDFEPLLWHKDYEVHLHRVAELVTRFNQLSSSPAVSRGDPHGRETQTN